MSRWCAYDLTFRVASNEICVRNCRDEIAGCSEKAYEFLTLKDAKKLLMFTNEKDLLGYIKEVWYPSHFRMFILLEYGSNIFLIYLVALKFGDMWLKLLLACLTYEGQYLALGLNYVLPSLTINTTDNGEPHNCFVAESLHGRW